MLCRQYRVDGTFTGVYVNDTYKRLCALVYDLSKPEPPEPAYSFYLSYAQGVSGPVLEPMCGSGRFYIPFLKSGVDIYGFDSSQHMLDRLYSKLDSQQPHSKVWEDSVVHFSPQKKFDYIFIPTGSFGLITDMRVIANFLEELYSALSDGGVFVFDVESSESISKEKFPAQYTYEIGDSQIHANYHASFRKDICQVMCDYDMIKDNQVVKAEKETITIKLYDNKQPLIDLLQSIGFSVNLLKAYERESTPCSNDPVTVFECWKSKA